MSEGDNYVKCDVIIKQIRPKAVLVYSDTSGKEHWIPRSCLHASSDLRLQEHMDEAMEI